jgi:CheY-like chemotaxis protein
MANILVVEDDKALNKAYKLILEHHGHKVKTAFDGAKALDKLENFKPDLILLDILMPQHSGIDFLKDYDLANKHPDVTVVVFTNLENAPEIDQAFELGVKKCVIKAWTPPQGLVKVIDGVLKESKKKPKQAAKV